MPPSAQLVLARGRSYTCRKRTNTCCTKRNYSTTYTNSSDPVFSQACQSRQYSTTFICKLPPVSEQSISNTPSHPTLLLMLTNPEKHKATPRNGEADSTSKQSSHNVCDHNPSEQHIGPKLSQVHNDPSLRHTFLFKQSLLNVISYLICGAFLTRKLTSRTTGNPKDKYLQYQLNNKHHMFPKAPQTIPLSNHPPTSSHWPLPAPRPSSIAACQSPIINIPGFTSRLSSVANARASSHEYPTGRHRT